MINTDFNHITYKKPFFKIKKGLKIYLNDYDRFKILKVRYEDLLRFEGAINKYNEVGENTLWQTVFYPQHIIQELKDELVKIYQMLHGLESKFSHLYVGDIDFCSFGNSKPFRIKIVNEINDNHDYLYVKRSDASRIYGLEFESIISPDKINFITDGMTIIEQHISGIPADEFIDEIKATDFQDYVRLTKEFVKFNERCFVKLLGDMRSYNYVVVITRDFDKNQYRFRAIDFDQQLYEGRKNIYLPQYFKDNMFFVTKAQEFMSKKTSDQYIQEEQGLIRKRVLNDIYRYSHLLRTLKGDRISNDSNIKKLREDLSKLYNNHEFLKLNSMGEIVELHISTRINLHN